MKILRNLFYVDTRVNSSYRYKDVFAIVPVEGIDELTAMANYYPCIIEVRDDGAEINPAEIDQEINRTLLEHETVN